jgi:hypothetical protein
MKFSEYPSIGSRVVFMQIHVYTHVRAYTYTEMHKYIHAYIHIYIHTQIFTYMQKCMHTDIQTDGRRDIRSLYSLFAIFWTHLKISLENVFSFYITVILQNVLSCLTEQQLTVTLCISWRGTQLTFLQEIFTFLYKP